jgi:hypothetical protein
MGSSESEARTTGEDPNGKDIGKKEYKEKDFQGMDPNHMGPEECMRELFQLNQAQKQQINRMEKRINDLENKLSQKTVEVKNKNSKVFDDRGDKTLKVFSVLKNRGKDGIDKHDLAEILDVELNTASHMIGTAAKDYHFIQRKTQSGPKPAKIYNKLTKAADRIVEFTKGFDKRKQFWGLLDQPETEEIRKPSNQAVDEIWSYAVDLPEEDKGFIEPKVVKRSCKRAF